MTMKSSAKMLGSALVGTLIINACQKEYMSQEKSTSIILGNNESNCIKAQRVFLNQFIVNPQAALDELLVVLLEGDEAQQIPICTRGLIN